MRNIQQAFRERNMAPGSVTQAGPTAGRRGQAKQAVEKRLEPLPDGHGPEACAEGLSHGSRRQARLFAGRRLVGNLHKARMALQLQNLALRHQFGILLRSVKRPRLTAFDRVLWAWLTQAWADWRSALVTKDVRDLIRKMSRYNPMRGAPRIHGELPKLGIEVGETSVGKYMVRPRKPPSQTWRTFLDSHLQSLVSVDFFTVPTIRFQILYVFLLLTRDRRRIVHFSVTAHPTAEWTAQQLREAFLFGQALRYLLRDRHRIFGDGFTMQIKESRIENASLPGEGLPGTATGAAAGDGTSRGGPQGRRPAPSLPTTGSVRSAVPPPSSGICVARGLCLSA